MRGQLARIDPSLGMADFISNSAIAVHPHDILTPLVNQLIRTNINTNLNQVGRVAKTGTLMMISVEAGFQRWTCSGLPSLGARYSRNSKAISNLTVHSVVYFTRAIRSGGAKCEGRWRPRWCCLRSASADRVRSIH